MLRFQSAFMLTGILWFACMDSYSPVQACCQELDIFGQVTSGDWPMWGGGPGRNQANRTTAVSIGFDLPSGNHPGKRVLWTALLGSQTYSSLSVSGGKVFIGTNNGNTYRPRHKGDRGVLLCFEEATGKFLWQLTREKMAEGRINDWPEQGIVSTACVEGNRLWIVTNRVELMCLDTEGFHDNENDGAVQKEVDFEIQDADIVWSLDMFKELGVFPHNLAISSPVVHGDSVFVVTGNGVDEAHQEIPVPRAPSFLAVNRNTGEVVWEKNYPGDQILHGQWSSPTVGEVNGQVQVCFAGGDGWLYALDPKDGEIIWKFDCNPKESRWEIGGRGDRNNIIGTPVFFENSVVVGVGQDPEHGEGVGHVWRIDASRTGDVSAELGEKGQPGKPNPNSAVLWHYGGIDVEGVVTGKPGGLIFRRTLSTAAVGDGMVFFPDLTGYLHCIDWKTGKRNWEYDLLAAIWGSAMLVDGKVFLGDEDGRLSVFEAKSSGPNLLKFWDTQGFAAVYSTPVFANGKLLLMDRNRIYVLSIR